ncbi:MAG TPA: amidohydrolase, partial [Blastocatellia bacterium]|nr:amidohydrolase [Blastocatellia bacterium]
MRQPRALFLALLLIVSVLCSPLLASQATKVTVVSGKRYPRLVIRGAMIVDGNGTPASGPKDIVIEGNTISEIVALDPVALKEGRARRPAGDV